jgi:hypothetical protein
VEKRQKAKYEFASQLSEFTNSFGEFISLDDEWTVKGFIDIFKNIYTISSDTKVISKILELHLLPRFLEFAGRIGYRLELANYQNWYPDISFINKNDEDIKFAVDLKTTYTDEEYPGFCNGFTLGSHGEYFINRESGKNIQYPYGQYGGHFCVGIIYSRVHFDDAFETRAYSVKDLSDIPSVIKHFTFFAGEKWKIASDKSGSGNTANIGSVQYIGDILAGNGVFAKAGEKIFDDYWTNFGKIQIAAKVGRRKAMTSFEEYVNYRGLPEDIINPGRRKIKEEPAK